MASEPTRAARLEEALRVIVTTWRTKGDRGRKWIYLRIWQAEALLEGEDG